ncbi:MAG: MiaB/RimO family radical SAM methylthiotransferase [Clostridium sp.]|nr:MiaB/RimO family radical SAM methylthiotransferase [Clostridium sp.]
MMNEDMRRVPDGTDFTQEPPEQEPQRQSYFLAKARGHVRRESERLGRPLTYAVITFGCQMNARDSEKLAGVLTQAGYQRKEEEDADFVILNTCTVRDNANQRVYGKLGVLNGLKRRNPHRKVALCGCMMQEQAVIDRIRESYRFVDLIFGTYNLFKFAELLVTVFENSVPEPREKGFHPAAGRFPRMVIDVWKAAGENFRRETGISGEEAAFPIPENLPAERKYSFKSGVNIMYGCNNFCSYCIVPYVRGRERSREVRDILEEIRQLVRDGAVEVMLLGQNVNSYGKNLEPPVTFARLLEEIEKIEGLKRIRFMTSHPKDLSDELIEVMKHSRKICRHFHLPLQSGSTRVLQAMNRCYTKERFIELALRIRRELPDVSLTTDIIVGFPGETPEDVDETIEVVRTVKFENAFTFRYSKRTGTPAAAMEQVPEETAKKGFEKLLKAVQATAKEQAARFQGQIEEVLVEEARKQEENGAETEGRSVSLGCGAFLLTGRLSNNLLVHFPWNEENVSPPVGEIVPVRLDECRGFYYLGTLADTRVPDRQLKSPDRQPKSPDRQLK